MDELIKFLSKNKGAIIGMIIAIIFLVFELDRIIIGIIIILAGMFIGSYVQKNKTIVKEKLKNLIDRM